MGDAGDRARAGAGVRLPDGCRGHRGRPRAAGCRRRGRHPFHLPQRRGVRRYHQRHANLVFDARADRRTGGATTPGPDKPTTYTNTAVSSVTGKSDGGKTLIDDATDTAPGTIQTEQNPPGPGPDIQKRWTRDFLDAQSGQRADTTLRWNVSSGFAPVTITDPATDAGTHVVDGL